ncbi:MAG: serine--tRNA ligase [Gammaproteobacteria bacterium]
MIDSAYIRENSDLVLENLKSRGYKLDIKGFLALDENKRSLQQSLEVLQAKRNKLSKDYGELKKTGKSTQALDIEINQIKTSIIDKELKYKDAEVKLNLFLSDIPNLVAETTPIGKDANANLVIRRSSEPKIKHSPDHLEITSKISTDIAAKLAGSRFAVLENEFAALQRALIQLMLTEATKKGYKEMYVPFIANRDSLFGTGQLPKFEEDLFKISEDYYLIPTAEVPLTNLHRDEIIDLSKGPLKYTAHTPCFRSEAGSYGKDTRGLIRQHQFEKVEIVQIIDPADSFAALEEMTSHAESILKILDLPYQIIELCSGDLGFSAAKTYDLEVWLPSQGKFREISSCSNCLDFQARRAKIRYKQDGKINFVHTLNGSALAAGRALIAVVENNFQQSGKINIPEALRDLMKRDFIET